MFFKGFGGVLVFQGWAEFSCVGRFSNLLVHNVFWISCWALSFGKGCSTYVGLKPVMFRCWAIIMRTHRV